MHIQKNVKKNFLGKCKKYCKNCGKKNKQKNVMEKCKKIRKLP